MRSVKPSTEKSRPKPYRPDATKATVNIVTKFLKKSKHQQQDISKKFKDKIKDKLKSDPIEPESIVTDLSSQKCYYDLTKPLVNNNCGENLENCSRISVIRTAVSSQINYDESKALFYQEKPMDFSPKNKYLSNGTSFEISRNYAMVA